MYRNKVRGVDWSSDSIKAAGGVLVASAGCQLFGAIGSRKGIQKNLKAIGRIFETKRDQKIVLLENGH
jgi:hypothetical protein